MAAAPAPDPAFERLVDRLSQAHGVRVVRGEGEAELARRSARTDLVVAAAGAAELRGRVEDVAVAAWLPAHSSERAAELLEAGLDEVVDAAMSLREQVARLEAAARRMPAPAESVSFGPLRVDRGRGEATWHGRRLPLTPRERDVLRELADGAEPPEIAAALHLSTGTVRNVLTAIVGKLNARNRTDAVRIAREAGWVEGR